MTFRVGPELPYRRHYSFNARGAGARHSQVAFLAGLALALTVLVPGRALAWGQEGHSIVAEIAQRRLTEEARTRVDELLGSGASLAAIASWADDAREVRPETYNWHFVDIPLARSQYDASEDCVVKDAGDCIVAALARLKETISCGKTTGIRKEALLFSVHFLGDIHQPFHTVLEDEGATKTRVRVQYTAGKCHKACRPQNISRSLHALWDETLIMSTVWDWGAYVERLEQTTLQDQALLRADGGSPANWADESHERARAMWGSLAPSRVVDDAYYKAALPVVDRQLALAGVRLARYLNEAFAGRCPNN